MTSFRAVLAKVPAEDRTQFLESMIFAKGRLVNIELDPIQGTLAERDVEELMGACGTTLVGFACSVITAGQCYEAAGFACDPSSCKGSKGARVVRLGDLLKDAPPRARQRFLDSLDFEDGKLTDADRDLLGEHLDEGARAELPRVGMP